MSLMMANFRDGNVNFSGLLDDGGFIIRLWGLGVSVLLLILETDFCNDNL